MRDELAAREGAFTGRVIEANGVRFAVPSSVALTILDALALQERVDAAPLGYVAGKYLSRDVEHGGIIVMDDAPAPHGKRVRLLVDEE